MLRSSLFSASALALLCATASAQSTLTPQKITAPIKDRGTYHMATGTWTRANPSTNFNSDVLFNNTASTGYFFGTTAGFNTVDHGRIPSDSSPTSPTSVTGNANSYIIDCFQIGYCSNAPAVAGLGTVSIALNFYDNYGPCTDVDAGVVTTAGFIGSGLPGGTPLSAQGCWVVAFDLANTSTTFKLGGDADGTWDNLANADSFGWGLDFTSATGGNGTGPFISGNCPVGGVTVPQQGFQTKFGGVAGMTDASGLGTNDFFWIDSAALGSSASPNGGCFFFGGCNTTPGPGNNPFGGYWLQLFGTKDDAPVLGTQFCTSRINASGSRAIMDVSGSDTAVDLTLHVTGLPNSTGQLFFGTMGGDGLGAATLGDGPLCATMSVVRVNPFLGAGMMMQPANGVNFTMNYTAPYAAQFTGQRTFQHWYRSTLATGTGSNGSSSVKVNF
ncbi:MAG: hypothetical protein ACI8QZ_002755 [Chlamydiales bacterium]|jgi:hypothetical protein